MRLEKIILVGIPALLLLASATGYSDTVELEQGDTMELGDYSLEFKTTPGEEYPELRLLEIREKDADLVLLSEPAESLYGEQTSFELSGKPISLKVEKAFWKNGRQRLNLTVESSEDIFSSAELNSESPERVISERDSSLSFDLSLENTGTVNQTFNLSSKTTQGVDVTYSYMGFNISSVRVPKSQSRSVKAFVEVGEDTDLGSTQLEFIAEGRDTVSESFDLEIRGQERERDFSVTLEDRTDSARPGDYIRPRLEIRNTGETEISDLEVDIQAPNGWEVSEYGDDIVRDTLITRDRIRHTTRIRVPQNAEPGDYYVELTANSENLESETKEFRVNISSSSGLSWIGIALMGLSLAGMIFVYWRLGRR